MLEHISNLLNLFKSGSGFLSYEAKVSKLHYFAKTCYTFCAKIWTEAHYATGNLLILLAIAINNLESTESNFLLSLAFHCMLYIFYINGFAIVVNILTKSVLF